VISVEGLKVGLTSSDILFHLGKEELSHPPRAGDRYIHIPQLVPVIYLNLSLANSSATPLGVVL
jgi:hypothetical protein